LEKKRPGKRKTQRDWSSRVGIKKPVRSPTIKGAAAGRKEEGKKKRPYQAVKKEKKTQPGGGEK